ncbi:hypothetical protein OM416_19940 [Paenibacillus sp. LS1]|uniref:hypothetical protein n=1 Tax=Paenibacillus sp. LS1 TaxID=2992120 RepID=UPI00222F0C6B|nr:hypothetical protein [Paenibacillus sp. LS1]MCW3793868.1 hypothetical protein [Paenibacillus sp. LS1]
MIEHLKKAEIKQPGSNPWKKVLKRPIYADGTKFYIRAKGFNSIEINRRQYLEVKKVLDTWFLI